MKITVLNDNAPGRDCLSEFGLSYLIEADKKILFDTGASDVFKVNAGRLNITLDDVDAVVLSHGHWDHGNGLGFLERAKLICHPQAFLKRYNKKSGAYIGLNQGIDDIRQHFDLVVSTGPVRISPELVFLGEVPRLNDFEAQATPFADDLGNDDFVPDDSALAVVTPKGLVVVSGCAHAGICNTIDYARKITGIDHVSTVFGGFHLRLDNEQTYKTIAYFKKLNIPNVYPAHCTALPALAKFYDAFKIHQVLTGDHFYF